MNKVDAVQVQFQPIGKRVSVPAGTDLLDAAREAGLDLASVCGGEGNCGQCRIVVLDGDVSSLTLDEEFILDEMEQLNGERLACCTEVNSDVTIHIPRESLITGQRLQIESNLRAIAVDPMVQAYQLSLVPPTMDDAKSDLTRVMTALEAACGVSAISAAPAVICQLSPILREQNWQVTVYVRSGEIVGLGSVGSRPLGFAVDLGTTKIAAYLVDLETGEYLAVKGAPNPQIGYGEDVISRLNHVYRNEDGGRVMAGKVRQTLNEMLGDLVQQIGASRQQVVDACIVGNTAMTHLLLQLPVAQLVKAPYVAAASSALTVNIS